MSTLHAISGNVDLHERHDATCSIARSSSSS
jgi:hypothetical protein